MPYILHYHDDTHDKPDTLDEELAQPLLMLQFNDERMRELRWRELAERRAGVPAPGRKRREGGKGMRT